MQLLRPVLTVALSSLLGAACASGPTLADERAVAVDRKLVLSPETTIDEERAIKDFTLRVRNKACLGLGVGSGVLIDGTTLVTNHHVVNGAAELEVETWSGVRQQATIKAIRSYVDLAIVTLDSPFGDISPAPIAADPEVGDAVRAAGYPLGGQITITAGKVTRIVPGEEVGQSGTIIEFDAPVRPGNSGGPLVDDHGEVVGIVFARNLVESRSLAVPVSQLEETQDDVLPPGDFDCG